MAVDSAKQIEDVALQAAAPEGVRCDFCGEHVTRVRRIALDGDYERLTTPHEVQYACEPCSERKEAERRGRAGS